MMKFFAVCVMAVILSGCSTTSQIIAKRDPFVEGTLMHTQLLPLRVALGFNRAPTDIDLVFIRASEPSKNDQYLIKVRHSYDSHGNRNLNMGGPDSLLIRTDSGLLTFSTDEKSAAGATKDMGLVVPHNEEKVTYKGISSEKMRQIVESKHLQVRVGGSNRSIDGFLSDDAMEAIRNLVKHDPKVLSE